MKTTKKILLAVAALSGIFLTACKEDGVTESNAILMSSEAITLPSVANTKTITVYADGAWKADVTDSWLSIDPTSGEGTTEVSVIADENVQPTERTAQIVVIGSSKVAPCKMEIIQKGDRFRDASEYSVSELAALEVGTLAKVKKCQVLALTSDGCIVSDGTSSIYVNGATEGIEAGDYVTLNGDIAEIAGIKVIALEDAFFSEKGTLDLPEPEDITSNITTFAPAEITYVTFDGAYSGGKFVVNDKDAGVPLSPLSSLGLPALDLHKVSVTGYYVGTDTKLLYFVVTSVTDNGLAGTILLQYEIETGDFKDANPDFGTTHSFNSTVGTGYIKYVPYDLDSTDPSSKFKMDISGNDPRCTGPWPGDYWLFYGDSPVKSGSQIQIKFGARTSATGHKYWLLEYLDGKIWKVAGTPKMSDDLAENVAYTAAMNADGATNVTVNETVTFDRNVDHLQFRFRCVSNWQASGAGALTARNGGSARLAVSSAGNVAPQPTVVMLKEGDGSAVDPVPAVITSSAKVLTFEGTPDAPKQLKITSDQDYTISASASWFTIDATSGAAGEETIINVTCSPSELSVLREGSITILSGETELVIPVIQSAAGVELKPLLSIVDGNVLKVTNPKGEYSVAVQSNVEVSTSSDASWLTVAPAPTKSMVEEITFVLNYEENTDDNDRVAHVKFYNSSENLEAVLTVTQMGAALFVDDFSWVKPWADLEGAGDSVGDQASGAKAPNVYTMDSAASFLAECVSRGYEDLNPTAKVLYLQSCYLKLSKGSNVGGIRLPAVDYGASPKNVTFSFDWCSHMGGTGAVDATVLVVELENGGTFADTGTTTSAEIASTQESGQMFWQSISLKINGATSATRIVIKPKQFGATSGYYRFHIDNLKIVETK